MFHLQGGAWVLGCIIARVVRVMDEASGQVEDDLDLFVAKAHFIREVVMEPRVQLERVAL